MILTGLPTEFAPAECASEEQIIEDNALYMGLTLLTQMLDCMPNMVFVLNQQRQIVFVNQATIKMLHLRNRQEVIGRRPGDVLDCVHAGDRSTGCGTTQFCRTCGAVKAILSSLRGEEDVQECQITLKNGDALDLRAWARPIHVQGRLFCVFSVEDISDEKRRHALERIFFHDVLNTASVVWTYAELMKQSPQNVESLVPDMVHSVERLMGEIQTQQMLMQAEQGGLKTCFTGISVRSFIEDVARQYEQHTVALGKHIRIAEMDSDLLLNSDLILLGRVLGNMIKNALEAAEVGETVTIGVALDDGEITFAVHNPTFMPHNVQLQVFNRSFSTKGAGRGLGTYSMKLLTERYLYGKIRFVSTREEGTIFFASYPTVTPVSGADCFVGE